MQIPIPQNDITHAELSLAYGNGLRKAPYGAGDVDEGYTLTSESMAAFEAWRAKEQEEKTIELNREERPPCPKVCSTSFQGTHQAGDT
jgi:hypothetical protein